MKTYNALHGFLTRDKAMYVAAGSLATAVNYGSYLVATMVFGVDYLAATVLAWCVSLLVAFAGNKYWVFESRCTDFPSLFREFSLFVTARLLSGFCEVSGMYIFVELCGANDKLVKIFVSVLVWVMNFLFSKFIIFRH